jgi:hypothetical protein
MPKRKKIFHGGCLGCLNQGNYKFCNSCCFKNADWDLPNLSKRYKECQSYSDIKEILDNIDIKYIEKYLREKKLNKIKAE